MIASASRHRQGGNVRHSPGSLISMATGVQHVSVAVQTGCGRLRGTDEFPVRSLATPNTPELTAAEFLLKNAITRNERRLKRRSTDGRATQDSEASEREISNLRDQLKALNKQLTVSRKHLRSVTKSAVDFSGIATALSAPEGNAAATAPLGDCLRGVACEKHSNRRGARGLRWLTVQQDPETAEQLLLWSAKTMLRASTAPARGNKLLRHLSRRRLGRSVRLSEVRRVLHGVEAMEACPGRVRGPAAENLDASRFVAVSCVQGTLREDPLLLEFFTPLTASDVALGLQQLVAGERQRHGCVPRGSLLGSPPPPSDADPLTWRLTVRMQRVVAEAAAQNSYERFVSNVAGVFAGRSVPSSLKAGGNKGGWSTMLLPLPSSHEERSTVADVEQAFRDLTRESAVIINGRSIPIRSLGTGGATTSRISCSRDATKWVNSTPELAEISLELEEFTPSGVTSPTGNDEHGDAPSSDVDRSTNSSPLSPAALVFDDEAREGERRATPEYFTSDFRKHDAGQADKIPGSLKELVRTLEEACNGYIEHAVARELSGKAGFDKGDFADTEKPSEWSRSDLFGDYSSESISCARHECAKGLLLAACRTVIHGDAFEALTRLFAVPGLVCLSPAHLESNGGGVTSCGGAPDSVLYGGSKGIPKTMLTEDCEIFIAEDGFASILANMSFRVVRLPAPALQTSPTSADDVAEIETADDPATWMLIQCQCVHHLHLKSLLQHGDTSSSAPLPEDDARHLRVHVIGARDEACPSF